MASLTLQIVSGLGTNTTTLTFSSSDASRIFTAWKAGTQNPTGTQAQFTAFLAQHVQNQLNNYVTRNEQTPVVSPVMTTQTT